jgi:hypothetical protein
MTCCRRKTACRFLVCLMAAALLFSFAGASPRAEARASRDPATVAKKEEQPGPVLAVVSLAKQRIWVWGRPGLIAQSAISTGMPGHRTPMGVFSVVQKSKFHRSNIYWNAPMPYMQRITWSGVTLHAGDVPGYPASHGCIRLPHRFAVELWGMTKIGARVVVAANDAAVLPIERSLLPVPKLTPAPGAESGHPQAAKTEGNAQGGGTSVAVVKVANASANSPSPPTELLNPLEHARLVKALAVANAAAKAKAAKSAFDAAAAKAAAARSAVASLRASESAVASARARQEATAKAIDKTTTTEMAARAKGALATAELRLAEAEKANEEARALEAAETAEAFAAAKAATQADAASHEAAAAVKAAERGTEPVSIFVSKKAKRVYIRQAWAPIYEAPVAFKDAEFPVGTHVYLAVAAEDNGETLHWLSVSLRPSAATQAPKRGPEPASPARASRSEPSQETAASALARFELSEETKSYIAERLWAGASLIVSDEGISNETGTYTDFIVLTR